MTSKLMALAHRYLGMGEAEVALLLVPGAALAALALAAHFWG